MKNKNYWFVALCLLATNSLSYNSIIYLWNNSPLNISAVVSKPVNLVAIPANQPAISGYASNIAFSSQQNAGVSGSYQLDLSLANGPSKATPCSIQVITGEQYSPYYMKAVVLNSGNSGFRCVINKSQMIELTSS